MDGHEASIAPGGKGQFDVFVDDQLIFSKHAEGRFPENDEILAKL
jgi:selT/selW/selH-like putative selenoprotein